MGICSCIAIKTDLSNSKLNSGCVVHIYDIYSLLGFHMPGGHMSGRQSDKRFQTSYENTVNI